MGCRMAVGRSRTHFLNVLSLYKGYFMERGYSPGNIRFIRLERIKKFMQKL